MTDKKKKKERKKEKEIEAIIKLIGLSLKYNDVLLPDGFQTA